MIGEVRWFNPRAGYGFINSGNSEYFVFYNEIKMKGYRKLEPGQKVIFQVKKYNKYKQAANVKPYDEKSRI